MKFQGRIGLLVMLVMVGGVARAQNPPAAGKTAGTSGRLLTVDDYFRIKEVADPQISPDGKWVAYTVETASLKDDKNRKRIWMIPSGGGTAIALTDENESSIASAVESGRKIFGVSFGARNGAAITTTRRGKSRCGC